MASDISTQNKGPTERAQNDDGRERNQKDLRNENGADKDGKDNKVRAFFGRTGVRIALAVFVVLVIAGGVIWWLIARQYEDTDDAFIDTHIVHVSPQIAGQVIAVLVNDNQFVRKGQLLVAIDSANAQLSQVTSQKAQVQTQYEQAVAAERGAAAIFRPDQHL